jgi:adenylosuccinate lyase
MPHKRNPVVAEQICGLARVVRSNAQAAFENIALWHERDISHSSVERVILPDSTTLVDYLLAKTDWLISGMKVDPARMKRNLDLTKGLVFSGQLLLDLAAAGMLREEAYRLVQGLAMEAWASENGDFLSSVLGNPRIASHLSAEKLSATFSVSRYLANVDKIFRRVFQEG